MIDAVRRVRGATRQAGPREEETLVKIVKHDFGLTIDIEELINKIDTDGSGEIGRGLASAFTGTPGKEVRARRGGRGCDGRCCHKSPDS